MADARVTPLQTSASKSSMWHAGPVFLAFVVMGFADAAGPFVSLAKDQFSLSNFSAQLISFMGFIMFGFLSVPMGVYQGKSGKKFILLLGLSIMLLGVLIPTIFGFSTFPVFLLTVLLLGAGATTLQVAGNPLVRDVSAPGKFSRNLSLAQFIKAIGSLSGPLIPVIAMRAFGLDWHVMFPVYSVAIAVTFLWSMGLRTTEEAAGQEATSFASCLALLKNGYVLMMVMAIFLYVGAEVSVSSGIPLLLKDRFGIDPAKFGLLGTGLFFSALTVGRLSGGVLMNWIKPKLLFVITCVLSIIGLLGVFAPSGTLAAASFFLVGVGFANIFPLVFSLTVDRMPKQANLLSGLMVTAIVGGAFVPPLMGYIADATHSMQLAFLVPLSAILYITWTAVMNSRTE